MKYFSKISLLVIFAFIFSILGSFLIDKVLAAWTEPVASFPLYGGATCSPPPCQEKDFKPITLGTTSQSKEGWLAIGSAVAPAFALDVTGQIQGYIFRDKDDPTKYLDPSSGSFISGLSATGNVSALNVTATGNVSALNVTATGNVNALNVTATGNVSAPVFLDSDSASIYYVDPSVTSVMNFVDTDTLRIGTSSYFIEFGDVLYIYGRCSSDFNGEITAAYDNVDVATGIPYCNWSNGKPPDWPEWPFPGCGWGDTNDIINRNPTVIEIAYMLKDAFPDGDVIGAKYVSDVTLISNSSQNVCGGIGNDRTQVLYSMYVTALKMWMF
ncbi:MAG: hypothetical protein AAB614_02445 [Patescibacteria group bacterium]